ncbi:phage tail protein [Enterococcus olivae]
MIIKVLSLEREYVAVLENAYNIGYDKKTNSIWSANFKLPLDDEKNEQVQHFRFVELWETEDERDEDYIGLFQIMPKETNVNTQNEEISYECRHVLRTLMGKSLFKLHQSDGHTTKENLEWLLSKQDYDETYWTLGQCEFTRYFSYAFENENLLNAILSIPRPFDEQYRWTWNTRVFPWVLNLVKVPAEPVCRLTEGHNLVGFKIEENPNDLFNRIYGLGSGEGVNQLDVTKINDGKPYVENQQSIDRYGLQEYIFADKRFTVKNNLLETMKTMLNKFSRPLVSWECTAAYLYQLTGESIDKFREGEIVRVYTEQFGTVDLRIVREKRQNIGENPGDIELELGDVQEDLGTTATDVERRQQINELWSQGATNVIPYIFIAEADQDNPIVFDPFFDDDFVHINTAELSIKTTKFRATSKANESIPQHVSSSTSSAGGAYVSSATSSAGGASVQSATSQAAGQSTQTSSANGSHRHRMFVRNDITGPIGYEPRPYAAYQQAAVQLNVSSFNDLYTEQAADNHTHSVTTPAHTHNVSINIPDHTHNVSINIPAHTHDVSITIPGHTHDIIYGIFEYSNLPSNLDIRVDGKKITETSTNFERFNIIPYLDQTPEENVARGNHTIEIRPNDLARVQVTLILRVFIRSNLGGEF